MAPGATPRKLVRRSIRAGLSAAGFVERELGLDHGSLRCRPAPSLLGAAAIDLRRRSWIASVRRRRFRSVKWFQVQSITTSRSTIKAAASAAARVVRTGSTAMPPTQSLTTSPAETDRPRCLPRSCGLHPRSVGREVARHEVGRSQLSASSASADAATARSCPGPRSGVMKPSFWSENHTLSGGRRGTRQSAPQCSNAGSPTRKPRTRWRA